MSKSPLFLVITTLLLACNADTSESVADTKSDSPAFDLQKARTTIDSLNAKFSEAVKKGDSVTMASNYASDAWLMFAHSEPLKGNEIVSAWGSAIRSGVKEVKLTTQDLVGNAELLAETGTYELLGENNAAIDKGKFVVIWKPENGTWKMYRDIANTSLPTPPAK